MQSTTESSSYQRKSSGMKAGETDYSAYGSVIANEAKSFLDAHGQEIYGYSQQQFAAMKKYAEDGNWTWKIAGLGASIGIVVISVLSFMSHFLGFAPFSAVIDVYLIAIGLALGILEYKSQVFTESYLKTLKKEALFLYRPYGRAAVYFFVGILFVAYSGLFGKILGLYTTAVGVIVYISSKNAFAQLEGLKGTMKTETEVIAKFNEFDKDRSGALDTQELAALCKALGSPLSMNELESALFILDKNNDGKIELKEFLAFWHGRDDIDV
jgi:hypothetical protein